MEGKGIFRITGEDTECLLDKNVYSYCIDADNNKLYYSGLGDGIIYEYDLGSGKSESIYESDNDTGYFYITEIISGWMMKDIRIWQCILTNRAVHLIIHYIS